MQNKLDYIVQEIGGYKIRENIKAKHVSLRMNIRDGLIITIPKNFKKSHLDNIINKKLDWIIENSKKIAEKRAEFKIEDTKNLPDNIYLPAIDRKLNVIYRPTLIAIVKTSVVGGDLIIYGNIKDHQACKKALRIWLHKVAKERLTTWIEECSKKWDLPFNKITIRSQKSRWGSCSSSKNISLNCKLLFLPKEYVKYIILHELSHTVQLNHSKDFWKQVAKIDPLYKDKDQAIKHSAWHKYIPSWADN